MRKTEKLLSNMSLGPPGNSVNLARLGQLWTLDDVTNVHPVARQLDTRAYQDASGFLLQYGV